METLKNKWVVISLVALAIILVIGFISTRNNAFEIYQAGVEAHENQDAEPAITHFEKVVKYPGILGTFITDAEERKSEIQASEYAFELRKTGQYQEAIDASTSFMDDFCSPYIEQSQQALLEIPFEWAEVSVKERDFAKAAELYEQIITDPAYPQEHVEKAVSALPPVYIELGKDLAANGEFESAIDTYFKCIETEPENDVVSQAKSLIQQSYTDWGTSLFNTKDYAEAIGKFELAIDLDVNEYTAEAREGAGDVCLAWANLLHDQGLIAEAAEKYGSLSTAYADTKAASLIPLGAFEPLIIYSQDVLDGGDYVTAAKTFETALSLDVEGQEDLKFDAIFGLGQALNGQELYLDAMHAYQQATELTDDSELLTSIEANEQISISGISQLTNTLGQIIIYSALEDTIPSETASTLSSEGKERCFTVNTGKECIDSDSLEIAYLAVGIDEEESRFLLYQEDEGRLPLPEDLQANRPGHFRYAAYLVHSIVEVESCDYYTKGISTPTHFLSRIQNKYTVSIYDTRTGELIKSKIYLGTNPSPCPQSRPFSVKRERIYGSLPLMEVIYNWFEGYAK